MTATLHPLVKQSDYIKLEDGSFSLPATDDYLLLDGAFCDDPQQGALDYNRALIKYLKRKANNNFGQQRYKRIFTQYADNRRIKKVMAVLSAARSHNEREQAKLYKESGVDSMLTRLESILFFYIPIEYLES
ncbi:hypothetical protein [Marinomonas sp. 2405UD68-3]|uniref:hypothetical protein n=1 Tax=Marinomonas sp. 2405UD68-3 TaxID=3391835 RepID=UPI0039C8E200